MLPDFLKEFKDDLKKYKRNYIKITAAPVSGVKSLMPYASKFSGKPFLPVGITYPIDKSGKPMLLWAQINFEEMPELQPYPNKGILQLFVSEDWFTMDDYKILFHENVECEIQTDFSLLTEDLYENSPFSREHKLTFSEEVEYGGSEDIEFGFEFKGKSYYEYSEALPEAQQKEMSKYFYSIGHRVGGYAYFTQGDPREFNEMSGKADLHLLQIDSNDKIMIGDAGVAHVFINPEDLTNRNFEKAYFYYDCC